MNRSHADVVLRGNVEAAKFPKGIPKGNCALLNTVTSASKSAPGEVQKPFARGGFCLAVIWILLFQFFISPIHAETDLPIVNVTAPTNFVAEGGNASFVFTSTETNGVTLRLEYTGTATNDFDFSPPLLTNLTIRAGTTNLTNELYAKVDRLIEGIETWSVKILPDPAYQIGEPSEATIEILDTTSLNQKFGLAYVPFYRPQTNFAMAPILPFQVEVTNTFATLDLRLFVDSELVDQRFYDPTPKTNIFTLTWQNPALGSHIIQFDAYDERGDVGSSLPLQIYVAAASLTPSRTFSLDLPSGAIAGTNVYIKHRPDDSETRGFVEFSIPRVATNLNAVLEFNAVIRQQVDVFAYAAGPTNALQILSLPRDFVNGLATNMSGLAQLDITPWARKFAGGMLGLVFSTSEIDPKFSVQSSLSNFSLLLNPPAVLDAGPHIRLLTQLPRVVTNSTVTISAQIFDPDSTITRAYLFDSNYVAVVDAPITPYPPGTNIVTFNVDLPAGLHVLSVRTGSLGRTALSQQMVFYIEPSYVVPAHRWLGSQNSSGSFYVVDSAGRAHVWGRNDRAQLGLGFTNSLRQSIKHPVTLLPPPGLRFRQIASVRDYAIALMDDGSLYVWGTNHLAPTAVPFPPGVVAFQSVGAREAGPVASDQRGTVWLWSRATGNWVADNFSGDSVKAGSASYAYRTPAFTNTAVYSSVNGILNFQDFAPANRFYGITAEGRLYWQTPAVGATEMTAPVATSFQRVAASDNYVLAMDNQGRLWAWDNGFFFYRNSDVAEQVPLPSGVTNIIDFTVTTSLAMFLTDTGDVYAWGDAVAGTWADSTATTAYVPEKVFGLPNLLDANATETAAAILSSALTPTGLKVQIAAPADAQFGIETSTDLVDWMQFDTFTPQPGVSTIYLPVDSGGTLFFRVAP